MGAVKIDKENIIAIVLVILFIVAGWLVFGNDLHDNGNGIDQIRNDLDRIEDQQRNTDKRLESVENGLADSEKRLGEISDGIGKTEKDLGNIADRIDDSAERATDDTERITEGQRILDDIRARGKTNAR